MNDGVWGKTPSATRARQNARLSPNWPAIVTALPTSTEPSAAAGV
jgi:hypothetical protein